MLSFKHLLNLPRSFRSTGNVRFINKTFAAKSASGSAVSDGAVREMEDDYHTDAMRELENFNIPFAGPFSSSRVGNFFQEHPKLHNQYNEDVMLKSFLKRHVPKSVLSDIEPDLVRFGHRVGTDLYDLSLKCEQNQPKVEHYDAWGARVDNITTSQAWKSMHDVAAEEGLIAIGYERKFQEWSRLYQFAKLYLFAPSSGLYSCPLAMTDGAAKTIESLEMNEPWLKREVFPHLLARCGASFWTSGQWMTERRGGSDVAKGTETYAIHQNDGSYGLYGYKWFSSATDADMTLTLARVLDSESGHLHGTAGLSLFYLELRDKEGKLNNIHVQRLKDKLGTRQLPTAELLLDGAVAYKVSEEGRGVSAISDMLKMTRIHNAISAASGMRRMINLSRDYSTRRQAFGNYLKDYPLHIQTLARMEIETRAAALLTFEITRLLGKEEMGQTTEDENNLIRLIVPLAKLYTGKQAVAVASEGLESFGGAGYLEDTGLPMILRDAQVLAIWEGTTNILSLDVLRAIAKSDGRVLVSFNKQVHRCIAETIGQASLGAPAAKVGEAADSILKFVQNNAERLETAARDLSFSLARTYMGALLLEHAASPVATESDRYTAQRWCEKELDLVSSNRASGHYVEEETHQNRTLVFDGYTEKNRL
ncbi:hypothetical protein ScPMuIL_005490 [Solemya velum]